MELIQTTEAIAKDILQLKNRIIKATKGQGIYKVIWINDNNHTCMLSTKKGNKFMGNCEDYNFYIQVPANAKTVY